MSGIKPLGISFDVSDWLDLLWLSGEIAPPSDNSNPAIWAYLKELRVYFRLLLPCRVPLLLW